MVDLGMLGISYTNPDQVGFGFEVLLTFCGSFFQKRLKSRLGYPKGTMSRSHVRTSIALGLRTSAFIPCDRSPRRFP